MDDIRTMSEAEHVISVPEVCFSREADTLDMISNDSFPRMRVTDELQVVADIPRECCVSRSMHSFHSAAGVFSPHTIKARHAGVSILLSGGRQQDTHVMEGLRQPLCAVGTGWMRVRVQSVQEDITSIVHAADNDNRQ